MYSRRRIMMSNILNNANVYGVEWNLDTNMCTRLGLAANKTATINGQNDFDTMWPWKDMRRCALKDDGTINYYLNSFDSSLRDDYVGGSSNLNGIDGQIMVQIPKFYYKTENIIVNDNYTMPTIDNMILYHDTMYGDNVTFAMQNNVLSMDITNYGVGKVKFLKLKAKNFIAEYDCLIHNADTNSQFYFRTTGWTNTSNSEAYFVAVNSTVISLRKGSNGKQNASTQLAKYDWTKTSESVVHIKVIANENNIIVYADNIEVLNVIDNTYVIDGYMGFGAWNGYSDNRTLSFEWSNYIVYCNSEVKKFWISDSPVDGFVLHPAFYRNRNGVSGQNVEVNQRYFAAFQGHVDGTKLESRSGVYPTASQTIGTFRSYAQNRGPGWGIQDYYLRYAIQLLYLIEYASFNSQDKIGKGRVQSSSNVCGVTVANGNYSGNEGDNGIDGHHAVSYRGIEDLWGNIFEFLDGIVTDENSNYLISNSNYNDIGTGYTLYTTGITSNLNVQNCYGNKLMADKNCAFLPTDIDGSSTTGTCDHFQLIPSRIASTGLAGDSGSGIFRISFTDVPSVTYYQLGTRLVY